MKQIDDNKIKQVIKEETVKPEINLTAQQILARHNEKVHHAPVKKSIFAGKQFKLGFGFLASILVVGAAIVLADNLVSPGISSSDPSIPNGTKISNKISGGKEGEFVFMSTSALLYAPEVNISPDLLNFYAPHIKQGSQPQINAEGALDQTLPLVDQFFTASSDFDYEKTEGNFNGKYGVYTTEYKLAGNIRLLANIEFEQDDEESETEIDGELQIGTEIYRFEGESEIDFEDNEKDISITIEYNEESYLEISSENENDEQSFSYHLVENDETVLDIKIDSYIIQETNQPFFDVDFTNDTFGLIFEIERVEDDYIISLGGQIITATRLEDNTFTYNYQNK